MPSYFLAETSKYFYLLFDEGNEYMANRNVIFSTEGHPFPIGSHLHRFSRSEECPISKEEVAAAPSAKGSRADYFHWSIDRPDMACRTMRQFPLRSYPPGRHRIHYYQFSSALFPPRTIDTPWIHSPARSSPPRMPRTLTRHQGKRSPLNIFHTHSWH